MVGACSTGGVEAFMWGNLRIRDHLGRLVVDGRTILKCIFNKWVGNIDLIDLA
jgi:hypothetical protein